MTHRDHEPHYQELAMESARSSGEKKPTQTEIDVHNARILRAIQIGLNETNEGGARPASHHNH